MTYDPVSGTRPGERSLGELFSSLTSDVSTLMRQEVALAKAEAKQSATRAGGVAAMFAGAGVAALLMLLFISNAAWTALTGPLGATWAAVVVALIWAIVAGVLAMVGKSRLAHVSGMPRTAETIKQIPNALKGNEEENR